MQELWHPSTLLPKESYQNYNYFAPAILDFSKQTEKINETANNEIKVIKFTIRLLFMSPFVTVCLITFPKIAVQLSQNSKHKLQVRPEDLILSLAEQRGRDRSP